MKVFEVAKKDETQIFFSRPFLNSWFFFLPRFFPLFFLSFSPRPFLCSVEKKPNNRNMDRERDW